MMLILGCDNRLYLLLHLSSFKKNVGQKVYIGDVVAEVGNTGYSNGAHLHLSVYKATEREKIWSKRDTNYEKNQTLRNPFDRNHNFKTDGGL
jgi:murein DD-endopeptidase MepM/ murein hydrolase activator NlpD